MLQNYFKIAWRTLLKNRLYTAINIAGLSVSIAGSRPHSYEMFHQELFVQIINVLRD